MELLFWGQRGPSSWESQLLTQLLGHNDPVIWNDSFPESMKGQIEHFIGADEKVTQKYMNFVILKRYVINDPSRLFFINSFIEYSSFEWGTFVVINLSW